MKKIKTSFFAIVTALVFSLGIGSVYLLTALPVQAQQTAAAISPDKARALALEATGGGVVTRCKLDNKFGLVRYEVTVHQGESKHDFEINAANGQIIRHNQKVARKPYHSQQTGPVITAEQAQSTALQAAGKGEVVKCKFTNGKKGAKYDITIISGEVKYEVDVNAYSNTVMKYEQKMVTELHVYPAGDMLAPQRAQELAKKQAGGGIVSKCTLDYKKDYSIPVYDIDVVKNGVKYKYHFNAYDGNILRYEIDYNYNVSEKR